MNNVKLPEGTAWVSNTRAVVLVDHVRKLAGPVPVQRDFDSGLDYVNAKISWDKRYEAETDVLTARISKALEIHGMKCFISRGTVDIL